MPRRRTPLAVRRPAAACAVVLVTLVAACGGDDPPAEAPLTADEGAAPVEATDDGAASDGATAADDDGSATDDDSAAAAAGDADEQRFPDVVDAVATQADDGTWSFDVTVSSPYDTPERYADAWRVLGPDGAELGVRELLHDHANEQPFTRSLSGVAIPDDVDEVTIEGRDQANGWGGGTVTIALPRA